MKGRKNEKMKALNGKERMTLQLGRKKDFNKKKQKVLIEKKKNSYERK